MSKLFLILVYVLYIYKGIELRQNIVAWGHGALHLAGCFISELRKSIERRRADELATFREQRYGSALDTQRKQVASMLQGSSQKRIVSFALIEWHKLCA